MRQFFCHSSVILSVFLFIAESTYSQSPREEDLRAGQNVNMVAGTSLPGGDPWLQRQNEPSLAVSTRNPRHMLAGANDYRTVDFPQTEGELPNTLAAAAPGDAWLGVYKSLDGGQTWTSTLIPGFPQDTSVNPDFPLKQYTAAADPTVRAGTNGLFYYTGIAFNRGTPKLSALFLARYIDNNNSEGADPIEYVDTQILDAGNQGRFLDMPSSAVDVPRGTQTVTIRGQKVPASNIYVVYSAFSQNEVHGILYLIKSTDCGQTWSKPTKLSEGNAVIQGAKIAVDPIQGTVYVVWRRFAAGRQKDAIEFCKSTDFGTTFSKPTIISEFTPFDQTAKDAFTSPPPGPTFRTNSYPTIAVDSRGFLHSTWSQKGVGLDGGARIVISTYNGTTWSSPGPVNNQVVAGHQFMPIITSAQGKIVIAWYDQRNTAARLFSRDWINDDPAAGMRQTIDIFAAQADPGPNPIFAAAFQVSKYVYVLGDDKKPYQAQFNPPNYPLFKGGTTPFIGDYFDIAASPAFALDSQGRWQFNTGASQTPLFHVVWTDNRDVRPPNDNDWTKYNPPSSDQGIYGYPTCNSPLNLGMRNQNIYTSRLTREMDAGLFFNTKPLGTVGFFPGGTALIPRTFVIYVRNNSYETRNYRLKIAAKPALGNASFEEFVQLDSLDVTIPSTSTAVRTVFAASTNPADTVQINVYEVVTGTEVLKSTIVLNQDPTNPAIPSSDSLSSQEIVNPIITNPSNPNIVNPNIVNWTALNPNIVNPNIVNPNIVNPNIVNPNIVNPNIVNPNIVNPSFTNPNIVNPNIVNPNIVNPNIVNPNIVNTAVTDVNWAVTNTGNTTATYNLKLYSKEQLPIGVYAQLIVYKESYTPTSSTNSCALQLEAHHDVLLSVTNPNIVNPNIVNPNIVNPNIVNSSIENSIFSVSPREKVFVLVRIIDTDHTATKMVTRWLQSQDPAEPPKTVNAIFDVQTFAESLGLVVVAQAVNTVDAQRGILTPPAAATKLIIATGSLPDGFAGADYQASLAAVGGVVPYSWSLNSGELPPGLTVSQQGRISGTIPVGTQGTYYFIVRVDDGSGQFDTQRYSIYVNARALPDPLAITTDSSLPGGVKGFWYGTTLEAVGGTWPRTWSLQAGSLPSGLTLDSSGTITGTPLLAGTFAFTLKVTDSGAPQGSTTKAFAITITASAGADLTISGVVYSGPGTPLGGVVLRGLPNTPITDINGYYEDRVPSGWSGAVFPFKSGYYFSPASRAYTSISTTQLGQDYNGSVLKPTVLTGFVVDAPTNALAGLPVTVTITARDSNGNTTTSVSGPTTLSVDAGTISPTFIPDTAFIYTGVWTGTVTLSQAGSTTVTASNLSTTGSDTVNVQSWNLGFNVSGLTGNTAGQNLNSVQVMAWNSVGPIVGVPITISIATSACPSASLTGTTTAVTDSTGWATFSNVQLNRGGWGYTLRASAGSPAVTVVSGAFNVEGFCDAGTVQRATLRAATLLPNGKTLVVGGYDGNAALSVAELYDPTTGVWSTTGSMNAARIGPTATLLPNGKVLVAGGMRSFQVGGSLIGVSLSSAELYEPATGTWSVTGPMSYVRAAHTATLLPSGQVLVTGGEATSTAELYDPAAGTWSTTGAMSAIRTTAVAVLLPNGKVLVAGGGLFSTILSSAEVYDPALGTWSLTTPMGTARVSSTGTLLPGGKVLVAGGSTTGAVYLSSAEVYDSSSGTWNLTGSLSSLRGAHTATLLSNGKVLVSGGYSGSAFLASAELYEPVSGTWTPTGSMATARLAHKATLLQDGRVIVSGGTGTSGYLSSAEIFYPNTVSTLPAGSSLSFVTQPTNAAFNQTISPAVRLRLQDAGGNAIAGVNVTILIGNNPSGGSPIGQLTAATDATGVATFANVAIDKFGSGYTLVAGTPFGWPSATSSSFDILPGPGAITTVAGTAWVLPGLGGPATSARLGLGFFAGIAADASGNVFVVDPPSHMVFKVSAGIITAFAGMGKAGLSGDGGPATSAMLNNPQAVALDSSGNVYIADTSNGRVRRVDAASGTISTAVTGLLGPGGLAFDAVGNLYISEIFGNRVRRSPASGPLTTIAGNGICGYSGDGVPATSSSLCLPRGLKLDAAGNLYIADSQNHRVRKVDSTGIITTVAGNGIQAFSSDGGSATATSLERPSDVALDATGNLYISDLGSNRVRIVNPAGIISSVAGNGTFAFSGDGGPATAASLANQSGICVLGGTLYIVDGLNKRVRSVSPAGTINTIAGSGFFKFSGNGGPATNAVLGTPYSVAVDAAGSIYIAENDNQVVRRVDASGVISNFVGTGLLSSPSGDGGLASSASVSFPRGVALDIVRGSLFVSETFYRGTVRKVDLGTSLISTLAGPSTHFNQLAVDASGNVYAVNESNFVIKVDTSGLTTTIAGTGVPGFSGDGGPAVSATLSAPSGIVVDALGNVYIADTNNNRIRKIDSGGNITTVVGTGTYGFSGDGGLAVNATLANPWGLALDSSGNLYIADTGNNRVRKVSPAGIIITVAGNGSFGLGGDKGAATGAALAFPRGIAVDSGGNLYIADTQNDRVRKVVGPLP